MPMATELPSAKSRRIVLCFDGTANKFTGDETDTNIVKIYEMLDRRDPHQFHYYQPGIGSYVQGSLSNSSTGNIFTSMKNSLIKTMDQGFGTSFVHHVLGGYSFLMRYYQPGDKIFIFGFSRGAYTARYLSEMIFNIGLLSRGNEEMVPFAWSTFSDFQRTRESAMSKAFMLRFKETFCREHITVHFLGLFDCVNSVAQFQIPLLAGKASMYMPMPPATHIRHAVSIHERRLMFKPALFLLDPTTPAEGDIKEVYFSGNHGDVGGGWHCQGANYLLSDIPLRWMVEEVLALPETENVLAWQKTKVDHMAQHEDNLESLLALRHILVKDNNKKKNLLRNLVHDPLAFGRGSGWFGVLSWWILECLPLTYIDLVDGKWQPRSWPPNYGSRRDISIGSTIHPSVVQLKRAGILTAKDMPRLGGEDPYDPIPSWNFFSLFKSKKITEPHREELPEVDTDDDRITDDGTNGSAHGIDHSVSNGTANGHANGSTNGHANGSTHGHANGSTHGNADGSAKGRAHKWNFDNVKETGAKTWSFS